MRNVMRIMLAFLVTSCLIVGFIAKNLIIIAMATLIIGVWIHVEKEYQDV